MTVKILCGDCRDVLPTLPGESFQTCVTSPPYWSLRDYKIDGIGLEPTLDEYVENLVAVFREVHRVLRPDGTLWLNLGDAYAGSWGNYHPTGKGGQRPSNTRRWKRRAYANRSQLPPAANAKAQGLKRKDLLLMPARVARALQTDGAPDVSALHVLERAMEALVNAYDGELPDRARVALERLEAEYLDAKGESWWLRSEVVWAKPNPMPESVRDRPTCAHEKIFLLTKQDRYFYDSDAVRTPPKNPEDDLRRINQASREHKSSSNMQHKGLRPREKQRGHHRSHDGRMRRYRADQPWLRELPMAVTRYALKYQAEAWRRCFAGGGRPRFKSRHREGSFTIPQDVRIRAGRLWVPKTGWYRLVGSNPYPDGEPVRVVVRRELGRWYAVVCYRVAEPKRPDNGMAVGVDMNHAPRAVAVSTGDIVPFADTARLEARKRRYQRVMARRQRGSNRRAVARRRAAKAHRKLRNVRRNWQHQTSRVLANTAGQVCYEDLRVRNMTAKGRGKRGLNRENLKPGWAGLRAKIEYKAALPTPVRAANTSQTCSACGVVDTRSRDGEDFGCVACGHSAHADTNAALNIMASGTGATGRRGALALATPTTRQYVPTVAA